MFDVWYDIEDILKGNSVDMHMAVTDHILEHDEVKENGMTGFQNDLLSYLVMEDKSLNGNEDMKEIINGLENDVKKLSSLDAYTQLQNAFKGA